MLRILIQSFQLGAYARKVAAVLHAKHGVTVPVYALMHTRDVQQGWLNKDAPESIALMVYYS
jgi:hypothetical protein